MVGKRARESLAGTVAFLAAWAIAVPACCQPPKPVVPDPTSILERFFGADRPEDEKALEAITLSPKEEEQLAVSAVQSYLEYLKRQEIRVVAKGREIQYLRRLVETIRPSMANAEKYRRMTIYLAESPRCDARSFPGGTLFFFRGLLDSAASEAALVGVIGHELSHLDHRHHTIWLRRLKAARQAMAGDGNPQSPEQFLSGGTAMARLWTRPFRPEDEKTADLDGARWAYAAGYDPRELGRVMEALGRQEFKLPLGVPSFLRTHPPSKERQADLLRLYEDLQQRDPKPHLYIGRENLRRWTTRAQRAFDE